jgi:hypothetical protein
MSEATAPQLDLDPAEELDERAQDGLVVTLLWHRASDSLCVFVIDYTIGDSFELTVEPGDDALEVFHHPYAYAAFRGIPYGLPAGSAAQTSAGGDGSAPPARTVPRAR